MPLKPLSFKGDKKPSKKRKHPSSTTTAPVEPPDLITASEDDTWTHPSTPADLTGPILLVLPSTPPTCLAADAHGAVFASSLENLIDANPFTSEPHDVRQVWVASRIAGSTELSLKAAHGGYLACEAGSAVISARRETRGAEEGWLVEPVDDADSADGRAIFRLRTSASAAGANKEARYLSAESTQSRALTLRGDGAADSPATHLILRMQARFKPQLQAQKTQRASEKVSRRELEAAVGRRLEDEEVRRLKRARRDGTYHEEILDVRVKGKHDKFAS
jgi:protein FRG1